MGIGSWGGGIVLGLVAVLWLVYLIPSWAKRQQYLATERNAVRLQQTLRILAQTAELPEEVRVEANAKSVASAQKILRSEEAKREAIRRAHEAARQRAITRELAATAPALRAADSEPALAARRLRRTRLVSTLALLLGVVAVVAGLAGVGWPIAVAGVVAIVGSIAVLTQLAAVSQARARRAPVAVVVDAAPEAQAFQDFAPRQDTADEGGQDHARTASDSTRRQWTPVAMPRPLYLRRGTARALARSSAVAGSPTSAGDAEALLAAAAASAEELRETQEAARLEAQRQALREVARAEAALQSHRDEERRGAASASAPAGVAAPAASASRIAPAVASVASASSAAAAPAAAAPAAAAPAPAAASRFARMGYVDEGSLEELRIDEVLQRRRAV